MQDRPHPPSFHARQPQARVLADRLGHVRNRQARDPGVPIQAIINDQKRHWSAAQRSTAQADDKLAQLGHALAAALPTPIAPRVRPTAWARGCATIACDNEGVRFEFDRMLRAGLRSKLQAALHGTLAITRFKLVVRGPQDAP